MSALPKPFVTESSLRGPRAVAVLDEAVSLLRRTPLAVHCVYYLGAFPFCLVLIYFYFDMTQGVDAEAHLSVEALLLTGLYFWMKTCQAVFARRLLALLESGDAEPWNPARWVNTALLQIIFAGSFFLVYPLAMIITIPFGWVSAFYHNISIVGTGPKSTVRSTLNEALELSRLWPKQNHLIIGIVFAALLFLFVNIAVLVVIIPDMLNMFFGIMTVFDENGSAWNNSSFYLDVLIFCFLILNPLNKAIYALRCFYGRSRRNGADLTAELRRQRMSGRESALVRALAVIVFLSVASAAAPMRAESAASAIPANPGATPGPTPAQFDEAIQKTLRKDEFAWRLPRPQAEVAQDGVILRTLRTFLKFLRHILGVFLKPLGRFLKWLLDSRKTSNSSGGVLESLAAIPWRLIFFGLLAVVVGCLLFMLVRYFHRRAVRPAAVLATVPVRTVDLEADDVRADDLPEDSWLLLARQLVERGELRLALRALYLATLSALAHGQFIRLGPAKSNRDYLVELTRRLRGNAEAVQFFRENINLFEASWYGTHSVTSAIIDTMLANHQQVRSHATA